MYQLTFARYIQIRKKVLIFFSTDFFPGKKVGASSSRELCGRSMPPHLLARLLRERGGTSFRSWLLYAVAVVQLTPPRAAANQQPGNFPSTLRKKRCLLRNGFWRTVAPRLATTEEPEGARLSREKVTARLPPKAHSP